MTTKSPTVTAVLERSPKASRAPVGAREAGLRRASFAVVTIATIAAIGYLVLAPMVELFRTAFADGARGFQAAAELPDLRRILLTTVSLAVGSVAVAMVCGVGLAIAAYSLPRHGRRFFETIPMVPLMIPAVALVTGWAFLLSPSVGYVNTLLRKLPLWDDAPRGPIDVYSVPWIIVIVGFSLSSFVFTFVNSGLRRIDRDLHFAAAVAGASPVRVWRRVLIPLVRPSLFYSAVIVFVLALGQFSAPLLLGRTQGIDVISTAMFRSISEFPAEFGVASALGVPIVACILLLTPLQRRLLRAQDRFVVVAGKGSGANTEGRWWAPIVISAYGVVAVALPILGLAYVSVSPFWTAQLRLDNLTVKSYADIFRDPIVVDAIRNTVLSAGLAVVLLLAISLGVSKLLNESRVPQVVRGGLDILVGLPLTIPGVIFGLGFLLAYATGPFSLYGSSLLFTVAFTTLFLPHAVRLVSAARTAISAEFGEAAAVFGAPPLRRIVRVELPMLRPALGAAALLIFILAVHEFAAALMVRSNDTQVLGTVLYDYWSSGTYPEVAAVALLMTAVTVAGAAVIGLLGGRDRGSSGRAAGLENLGGVH